MLLYALVIAVMRTGVLRAGILSWASLCREVSGHAACPRLADLSSESARQRVDACGMLEYCVPRWATTGAA